MLYSRVFAKLQHLLDPQNALPRSVIVSAPFIQSLWFHAVTHSFAQRAAHICPIFNHFRALSIVTEGVGGALPQKLTTPGLSPIPYTLSPFFSHSCALSCTFLHPRRIQLLSFQAFPHSASKNTTAGGGGRQRGGKRRRKRRGRPRDDTRGRESGPVWLRGLSW